MGDDLREVSIGLAGRFQTWEEGAVTDILNEQIRDALVEERVRHLAEDGYRREGGWDRFCPSPDPRCPDEFDPGFTWEDHRYMLTHPDRPTIYVSEPYDLDGEDFGEMAKLVAAGWDVRIMPHKSLWNPGSTITIWMSREGAVK